jgi:hypothetical protein
MYLLAFFLGVVGLWILQLGLRTKSMKQRVQEIIRPDLEYLNNKEKSLRIFFGLALLIASLVIFLRS